MCLAHHSNPLFLVSNLNLSFTYSEGAGVEDFSLSNYQAVANATILLLFSPAFKLSHHLQGRLLSLLSARRYSDEAEAELVYIFSPSAVGSITSEVGSLLCG